MSETATATKETASKRAAVTAPRLPVPVPDTEPDSDKDPIGYLLFHGWRPLADPRSQHTRWKDPKKPARDIERWVERDLGTRIVDGQPKQIKTRQLVITHRGASYSREDAVSQQIGRGYAKDPAILRCRVMVYVKEMVQLGGGKAQHGPLVGESLDFPGITATSEHPDPKHREFDIVAKLRRQISDMLLECRLDGKQPKWADKKQPVPYRYKHQDGTFEDLPMNVMILDIPRE